MKRLRKLRIYGAFLLVFTFSVSVSSCDVMLAVLDEMAETEQTDNSSGGGDKEKGKTKDDDQKKESKSKSKGKQNTGGG